MNRTVFPLLLLLLLSIACSGFAEEVIFPSDTGGWTLKSYKIKSLIIHDTEVLYENGVYYGAMTNDEYVYASDDLKTWKRAGIRPTGWYSPEENNYLTWAPCMIHLRKPYLVNGEAYEYALFDALSHWGSQDSRIRCFVMKEPAPDSKRDYVYVGDVMSSGKYAEKVVSDPRASYEAEDTGAEGPRYYWVDDYERGYSAENANGWNAIDPSVLYDQEGKLHLVWGSYFGGIFITELDQDTLMPLSNRAGDYTRIAYQTQRSCIEGPTIFYHEGYYYLNVAYGDICYSYNTRIARSKEITGPYLDYNGASMLKANGTVGTRIAAPYAFEKDRGWRGQGHCAWVYNPDTGETFLLSNGRTAEDEYARQMVRSVYWLDGWPVLCPEMAAADTVRTILDEAGNAVVSPAAAPSMQTIPEEMIPGEYEIIVFQRLLPQFENQEKQETSSRVTLAQDGSIFGAYKGSWHLRADGVLCASLNDYEASFWLAPAYDWERNRSGALVLTGLTAPGSPADPMAGTAVWIKSVEQK